MSFVEETKQDLVSAYFQLILIIVLDVLFMAGIDSGITSTIKMPDWFMWFIIGLLGFFTLISIIRIILLHLAIYYWKRGD